MYIFGATAKIMVPLLKLCAIFGTTPKIMCNCGATWWKMWKATQYFWYYFVWISRILLSYVACGEQ